MNVGDIVYPKTNKDAFAIGMGFTGETTVNRPFKILVIVDSGVDYHGQVTCMGAILQPQDTALGQMQYPYIWDITRLTKEHK